MDKNNGRSAGSYSFFEEAGKRGLSAQLRVRDEPFEEVDAWWRTKLAARPKLEKGRLEAASAEEYKKKLEEEAKKQKK